MTGERTPGTRIEHSGDGIPPDGFYYKDGRTGQWCAMTPNGHLANLANHAVVEHEDGTITVSPSILVFLPACDESPRKGLYHGYLERGVWREC